MGGSQQHGGFRSGRSCLSSGEMVGKSRPGCADGAILHDCKLMKSLDMHFYASFLLVTDRQTVWSRITNLHWEEYQSDGDFETDSRVGDEVYF